MGYIYSEQERETEEHALPNVEVFFNYGDQEAGKDLTEEDGDFLAEGWYWAAGFPGYAWDGEPSGPFNSEAEAIADAQEGN